jgi:hypothetical protein
MLAEYSRRAVVQSLERAAVEQLCGPSWVAAEDKLGAMPGDRWTVFAYVCMEKSLAYGEKLPQLQPEIYPRLVSRLQIHLRAAVPDLWTANLDNRDPDALAEALDTAVLDAWDDLRKTLVEEGRSAFDEDDVNSGASAEVWKQAIQEAMNRLEISPLLKFVLPKRRAHALRVPDYAAQAAGDMVSLLDGTHVDVQGNQRFLSRDDIAFAFRMWTFPRGFINAAGWKDVACKLLADRQTARAVRYAALRFRASRSGAAAFRGIDV